MATLTDVKLAECRRSRLLTQAELAAKAGVTPSTVYNLERGKHRPQLRVIRKISEALGVEPGQIDEFAAALAAPEDR